LPCLHICPYCDSILNWYFYLQLQDLQSELEMDRQEKGELKQQIDTQREELDSFKMQAVEATIKQENETDSLKTTVQDLKKHTSSTANYQSWSGQSKYLNLQRWWPLVNCYATIEL
jgi:DNA repair exonuclease SbcCD ATPase subunit